MFFPRLFRSAALAALGALLGSCSLYDRMDAVERDLSRVKQIDQALTLAIDDLWLRQLQTESHISTLAAELRGVSTTQVTLPADGRTVIAFGNGSGYNAAVTFTTISASGTGKLTLFTRRIVRPSDRIRSPEGPGSGGATLPPNFDHTEPLDVTAVGARRQIIVPCGYEVAAQGDGMTGRLGVVIKYGEACAQ